MLGLSRLTRRLALLFPLVGLACSSPDVSGPRSVDLDQLPWRLVLNAHAITMSTADGYNTMQLTATPSTIDGALLVGAPTPSFISQDSSVRVSATGLITARSVQHNVRVIATLVYQGVRISDTALVNVTNETAPHTFRQLQLHLMPGDSARIAAPNPLGSVFYYPNTKTLQVGAQDSTGTQIPQSLVALRTSDVLQATVPAITTGQTVDVSIAETSRIGAPVTIYASATVYGVTVQDSLQLLVTDQLHFIFSLGKSTPAGSTTPGYTLYPSDPRDAVIGVGGWVWWWNEASSKDSLDIVFDDPTMASVDTAAFGLFNSGGGNIAPFAGNDSNTGGGFFTAARSRQFLHAGSFHFRSLRTGVSGTIVVR